MISVRYTYRLRPGAVAVAALTAEWDRCRWVWNALTAESKARHIVNEVSRSNGYAAEADLLTFGYKAQDGQLTRWRREHPWLAEGSSVAQQQMVRDFDAARSKALKDRTDKVAISRRRGLPRFKAKAKALPSMNYTVRGFNLIPDKTTGVLRLKLPRGIVVPVVWSRGLPSEPKSVRVSMDSLGHWYASFVVQVDETTDHLPATGGDPIGVDWGVSEIATTTSDNHDLPHRQRGKNAAAGLARYQRRMARRKPKKGQPGSRGYQAAKKQTAVAHKKIARQRQDDGRKWAKNLVRDHDRIAVEDFKPKFMASNRGLARKAADGAIAATKTELIWMATKHGRDLRLVNPAHTTMDCSECDARAKHQLNLSERTYTCENCGVVKPRDKNSAAVMVVRAFGPAAVSAGTSEARAGSDPEDVEGNKTEGPRRGHQAA